MNNKKLERAILFSFLFTNFFIGQAYANTQTLDSITVYNGEHKEITNNNDNVINTDVYDNYGISVDNGELSANFNSLNIEHNINRSNKFIGVSSDGSLGLSNINITTKENFNLGIKTTEVDSMIGLSAKNQAGLKVKSENGDININLDLKIGISSQKENHAIESLDNANMQLSGNNINISSNLANTNFVNSINKAVAVNNSSLDINAQQDINISAIASGKTYSNYGIYIQDTDGYISNVSIISDNNFNLIAKDNNSKNESFGIYVENYEDSKENTNLLIQSKNNTLIAQDTVLDVVGERTLISLIANDGSNILKSSGKADSTGIEVNGNAQVYLQASQNNIISGDYAGIHISFAKDINSNVIIKGQNNQINALENGILSFSNGVINVYAISGSNEINSQYFGVSLLDNSYLYMNANNGNNRFIVKNGIGMFLNNSKSTIVGDGNYLESAEGLVSMGNSRLNFIAQNNDNIINVTEFGLYTRSNGQIMLSNETGDNNIFVKEGIGIGGNEGTILVKNKIGSNIISVTKGIGIEANNGIDIQMNSLKGSNIIKAKNTAISLNNYDIDNNITGKESNTQVSLSANSNTVEGSSSINTISQGKVNIEAINGNNILLSTNENIIAKDNSEIKISSDNGNNLIQNNIKDTLTFESSKISLEGKNNQIINVDENGTVINLNNMSNFSLLANQDNIIQGNIILIDENVFTSKGNNNYISGLRAINSQNKNIIDIIATNNNIISAQTEALKLDEDTSMQLEAKGINLIQNQTGNTIDLKNSKLSIKGGVNNIFNGKGIYQEYYSGTALYLDNSSFSLQGITENIIGGNIYATNNAQATINVKNDSGMNYISSSAYSKENIISAIYATNNANVSILADNAANQVNYISVKKNSITDNNITVFADGGTINLTGTTVLESYSGTATALLSTTDAADSIGNIIGKLGANSSIQGSVIANNNSKINLDVIDKNNNESDRDLILNGDINAKNSGLIEISTGNKSIITGNINDYFYKAYMNNIAFANEDTKGTIKLILGDTNKLSIRGQSFISALSTGNDVIIDMISANKTSEPTCLMVDNLEGNANVAMHLSADRPNSDMLYLNNGKGSYNLILDEAVTNEDIGKNGLRFATVGNGNEQTFSKAFAYDSGAFNVEYKIGTDDYNTAKDNDEYNNESTSISGDLTENKPGSNLVNSIFNNKNTATNYKLIGIKDTELSSAGKTILNMTKANYNMAVYMSRLDKRLGEAQYITDNDGLWYKMRHEKIDKDTMFTIDSNMYELGYDKLFNTVSGKHRIGMAIDYMKGSTHYDNIAGGGESNRKGLWFYDTWLGNDGHYSDYVLKWGRLENTFDIYGENKDNLITGEYDNNVYSLSAEYGYKQNLKDDWYVIPQIQIQYAKVSSANYSTNQNTNVSVDGINSLIGRLGFRIGKDFKDTTPSTLYFKVDVLHEFLGDQFVSVEDSTTDDLPMGFNYEHKGTWYDLGIGFNIVTSENSYVFLDYERRFGNDNSGSYQINGGVNWLL